MSKPITIRNALYDKLKSEKGNSSFSDVIESYMNKHERVVSPAKDQPHASQHTSEGVPTCQDIPRTT